MKLTPETYVAIADRAECLVTQEVMETALDRMAETLTARLAGTDPVVLSVVTGGIIAAGLLLPRLNFALRLGYVHATRYDGTTRGGELAWHYRPSEIIRGEQVLILDDILDEGITLDAIIRACREDGAAGVHTAVLVEKERSHACAADVVGVVVPDRYVFGYGLDYKGYFRNVPGIFAVADQDR
ncbi:hypoxanthine-guanine phosphoribosyltransferase [uncultured Thiodictyon sp.]|uniref:hypoxanthine-guanine phosphoribosyltransferase n=1 Tax=uncultured Thiodictyon sp. TaxID=1846217 RepID=UPI0025D9F9A0|nr:hypoxanthine-guanine phosphoribosyltransferase [uncultured Thiodictyon sp.]